MDHSVAPGSVAAGLPGAPGERDGVVGEHDPVEVGVDGAGATGVLLGEDEVEVAAGDAGQARLGVALGDLDAQRGMLLRQVFQRVREQRVGGGLEHRDAHRPGDLGERFGDRDPCVLQLVEDADGLGDEHVPLGGELHPAADAAQQRHADVVLQRAQLLRHRGLAVGQGVGDRGERSRRDSSTSIRRRLTSSIRPLQSFSVTEQKSCISVDRRSVPTGRKMIQPLTNPGVRSPGRFRSR